jgi:hypothetical protein
MGPLIDAPTVAMMIWDAGVIPHSSLCVGFSE